MQLHHFKWSQVIALTTVTNRCPLPGANERDLSFTPAFTKQVHIQTPLTNLAAMIPMPPHPLWVVIGRLMLPPRNAIMVRVSANQIIATNVFI